MISTSVLYLAVLVPCIQLSVGQVAGPTPSPVTRTWTENTMNIYPSPQSNPPGCNRPGKSWICDPNSVLLPPSEVDKVDAHLVKLRVGTEGGCLCSNNCSYTGLPIIVTVMENFGSMFSSTHADLMENYAKHFHNNWLFYECDDGIVYVIGAKVTSTDKVYRYFSKNVAAVVSSQCQKYIATKTNSLFNDGNIIGGLEADLQIYSEILANSNKCEDNEMAFISIIVIVIILAVIISILIAIILIKKRQKQKMISGSAADDAGKPLREKQAANA